MCKHALLHIIRPLSCCTFSCTSSFPSHTIHHQILYIDIDPTPTTSVDLSVAQAYLAVPLILTNINMTWCVGCDRYFVNQDALQQHYAYAAIHRPVYYCEPCREGFSNAHGLENHKEVVHYWCKQHDRFFRNANDLRQVGHCQYLPKQSIILTLILAYVVEISWTVHAMPWL